MKLSDLQVCITISRKFSREKISRFKVFYIKFWGSHTHLYGGWFNISVNYSRLANVFFIESFPHSVHNTINILNSVC